MANDITKVKMGVCSATFKSVALGHTKGGVVVTYVPEFHEITVDQYGNTPAGARLLGERLTAKVPLVESTLANLNVAIPTGTIDGTKMTIGSDAGVDMSALAGLLVLHPIANEVSDLTEDVVLYKAFGSSQVEIGFTNDGEKIFEVEFLALIDESKESGNRLGLIGNSAS